MDAEEFAELTHVKIEEVLAASPVMPVVTIRELGQAAELARALVAGGIRVIEVTLRTPVALEAISAMVKAVPEAIVGAGTVCTRTELDAARDAGAVFAVSPGATPELLDDGAAHALPFLPGVATASEIMAGLLRGYSHFKFFPAGIAGGTSALAAFAGPFPAVRFCPTGGITAALASNYLALPNVLCVGGSWLVPDGAVRANDWTTIEGLAHQAATSLRRHGAEFATR